MSRRNKFLIFLPAMLALSLSLLITWLLHTQSGAGFLWQQAGGLSGGQISAERVQGNLSSSLVLQGFRFSNDGVQVDSPQISLSINLDLFPPAVRLSRLSSESVRILLLPGSIEDQESSLAETLASLQLPLPLQLEAVEIHHLQILDTDSTELFAARDISLRADWYRKFELHQLRLHSLDTDWNVAALLRLDSPFAVQGKITADSLATIADDQPLPLNWQADFSGDLATLNTRLQVTQPGIFIEGKLLNLLTSPAWDLQLQSEKLDWPLTADPGTADSEQLQLSLNDIQMSSQGNWSAYELQLAAQLSSEQLPGGATELIGSGDSTGIHFDHFRFTGDELALTGTAELDWQQGFVLTANNRIVDLQPTRWLADWPQQHPLTGNLQFELTAEQIEFHQLTVNITDLATQVQGNGIYHFSDGEVAAQMNWQSLTWPLLADGADKSSNWSSPEGQMTLAGQIDDWNGQGQLQLLVEGFPQGRLQFSAKGSLDAVQLVIDEGHVLGGQFAGTVDYRWAEPANWSAKVTAEQLNTAPLLPDYPGVISGTLWAKAEANSSNLQFDLRDVKGRIRDQDFTAKGKFSLQDSAIEAEDLQLRSGSARVQLDGGMGPGQTLRFSANVDEFAELWPEASGRLQASGKLSLDAQSPVLEIELEADELFWGENHIASIRTLDGPNGSRIIKLEQATLAGREFQDVQLTLAGQQALESVQLQGQMDQTQFSAALRGQLVANKQQRISGWNGMLESLRLSQPERGFLNLDNPAALSLSVQESSLGTACLRGSKDGLICLQGQWSELGKSSLQTEVQQVSLDIVRLFVDMDWAFTHRLDGRFDWQKSPQQSASAKAQFTLSPGELLFEQEVTNFSTGAGQFEFQISDGNLHSGKLSLPIPGSGDIQADFNVERWLDGATAELQASLKLSLLDLTPLQLVVPYIDVIKGELNADIRINGSLEDPQFTGHATLVRGLIEEHAMGLVLSDIQLAGAVYQYDHTELFGSFRAGNGRGQIKADLRFENFLNPQFSMQLKGENLLLVDVPDLNLLAEPDLDIVWTPGKLQLNGRILVPKAQLSPRYLPASTAIESPDLVIVSEQQEVEALPATELSGPLKITGQVEVELGNEVSLTLDRATANIRGKTNFIWNDQLLPIGDGTFRVSGEIYAYGQLLSISEGRVSFPRSPADNPHLNIKAEREIFGNTQIKYAGVRVSGTLKQPILEPYTDPMTTRERALAMLITGSDFDYEQGVGAVEVGMYIAPKLFVSYGIGLFEDQNVISARYDLGRGFGVKATSGQRETGVDISYTIEQ